MGGFGQTLTAQSVLVGAEANKRIKDCGFIKEGKNNLAHSLSSSQIKLLIIFVNDSSDSVHLDHVDRGSLPQTRRSAAKYNLDSEETGMLYIKSELYKI